MASLTRWTLVWVNSGSWWWTGRPGVLWFMGSQRVGPDWVTELNWTLEAARKESACNAGDPGSIPGLGRSPGEGHSNPLQYSCLENPHGQRSLVGYGSWWGAGEGVSQRVGLDWTTKHKAQIGQDDQEVEQPSWKYGQFSNHLGWQSLNLL